VERGAVLRVEIAEARVRGLLEEGAVVVLGLLLRGMMNSLPSWIQTRLASFSGLSHLGVTLAASMRRNSPSLSDTRIQRLGNALLSSRRR
jgi:hypothetical protein